MGHNVAFAPMAATNTGSGFRYSFGTGETELRGPLPAGRYPFAVYGWATLGVRDSHDVKVLTTVDGVDDAVGRLLLSATAGGGVLSDAESAELDVRHYDAWVEARAAQIERTRAHVEAQRASLGLTHAARCKQLEDQVVGASHDKIRRMKESELAAAEADFERRSAELAAAAARCDVTTTLLCRGVLEVT